MHSAQSQKPYLSIELNFDFSSRQLNVWLNNDETIASEMCHELKALTDNQWKLTTNALKPITDYLFFSFSEFMILQSFDIIFE